VLVEAGGSARVVHQEGERKKAPHEGQQTVVTLVKALNRFLVGFAKRITHFDVRVLLVATPHAGGQHKGQFWAETGQHVSAQLHMWVRLVLAQRSKVLLDVSGSRHIAGKWVD